MKKPSTTPEVISSRIMGMNRETLSGTLPRWLTPILLAVCAYYQIRQITQQDALAKIVGENATSIVVMKENLTSITEALSDIEKITRLLEQRLARLEIREELRKP